jgi:hypothetical protein
MLAGERDSHALCSGLDADSAAVVDSLLALVARPPADVSRELAAMHADRPSVGEPAARHPGQSPGGGLPEVWKRPRRAALQVAVCTALAHARRAQGGGNGGGLPRGGVAAIDASAQAALLHASEGATLLHAPPPRAAPPDARAVVPAEPPGQARDAGAGRRPRNGRGGRGRRGGRGGRSAAEVAEWWEAERNVLCDLSWPEARELLASVGFPARVASSPLPRPCCLLASSRCLFTLPLHVASSQGRSNSAQGLGRRRRPGP